MAFISNLWEPYFFLVVGNERELDFFASKTKAKIHYVRIKGERISSKRLLFKEIKDLFLMPDYFNESWDSLDECLNDLSWIDTDCIVLSLLNADTFLSSKHMEKFISILNDTVDDWVNGLNSSSPKPFRVIFHCKPQLEKITIHKLNELGINKINKISIGELSHMWG
jgi:RNAse (barnase) inhibitor barstar